MLPASFLICLMRIFFFLVSATCKLYLVPVNVFVFVIGFVFVFVLVHLEEVIPPDPRFTVPVAGSGQPFNFRQRLPRGKCYCGGQRHGRKHKHFSMYLFSLLHQEYGCARFGVEEKDNREVSGKPGMRTLLPPQAWPLPDSPPSTNLSPPQGPQIVYDQFRSVHGSTQTNQAFQGERRERLSAKVERDLLSTPTVNPSRSLGSRGHELERKRDSLRDWSSWCSNECPTDSSCSN